MTPQDVRDDIADFGEPVVILRQTAVAPPEFTSAVVRAVVRQGGTKAVADTQQAGRWSVIVSANELKEVGFPGAVEENDVVIIEPQLDGTGAYLEGTGRALRVTVPGRRGAAGFWMTAEG